MLRRVIRLGYRCPTCPTCPTCLTSQQSRLPFSRWREKGPGDEGGDRATATLNAHGTAVPCYDEWGLYVAIRCQAVEVARKSPPSGDEWLPVRLVRLVRPV